MHYHIFSNNSIWGSFFGQLLGMWRKLWATLIYSIMKIMYIWLLCGCMLKQITLWSCRYVGPTIGHPLINITLCEPVIFSVVNFIPCYKKYIFSFNKIFPFTWDFILNAYPIGAGANKTANERSESHNAIRTPKMPVVCSEDAVGIR